MKEFYLDRKLFKGTEEEFLTIEKFCVKNWYQNGKTHRDGGPALIYSSGAEWWCRNGKYHRDDGPAYIHLNGAKHWYKNGKWHRTDGPAVIRSDGRRFWYIENLDFQKFFDQFFPMINYIKDRFPGE